MQPLSLRNLSVICVAHRTYGKDLNDIFDHTFLPNELVQVTRTVQRGLSEWNTEMLYIGFLAANERNSNVQNRNALDLMKILGVDIIEGDKNLLRWTESSPMNISTVELDRAATARRILTDYEPTWYSAIVNDVAFVLASMFCLEEHVRRIWPHSSRQEISSTLTQNPAASYWSHKILNQPVEAQQALKILVTTSIQTVQSIDYCYAIIRAFWPIIVREFGQFPAAEMMKWLRTALLESIAFHSGERVRTFLWEQIPADSLTLIIRGPPSCYSLLRALLENGQCKKFIEIWTLLDDNTRREGLRAIRMQLITASWRANLEIHDHILRTMVIGRLDEAWIDEFAEDISSMATAIWKRRFRNPDERRRQFREEYADLVPLIAREVQSCIDIASLWDESTDDQRIQILVANEGAAFRNACALNRLEVVKFLWEKATPEQRRLLITQGDFDAFTANLPIFKILWEKMDTRTRVELIESQHTSASLSRLICTQDVFFIMSLPPEMRLDGSAFPRQQLEDFLPILVTDTRSDDDTPVLSRIKSIFLEALMLDDGSAFKCLYRRAKDGGNPALFKTLLSVFDHADRSRLRTVMSAKQAGFCGYDEVSPNVPWVDDEDSLDYS